MREDRAGQAWDCRRRQVTPQPPSSCQAGEQAGPLPTARSLAPWPLRTYDHTPTQTQHGQPSSPAGPTTWGTLSATSKCGSYPSLSQSRLECKWSPISGTRALWGQPTTKKINKNTEAPRPWPAGVAITQGSGVQWLSHNAETWDYRNPVKASWTGATRSRSWTLKVPQQARETATQMPEDFLSR